MTDPTPPIAFQASVSITVADFVNIDDGGKANVVGGGIRALPLNDRGDSAPFGVLASISLPNPPSRSVIVELVLTGPDGESVRLPSESVDGSNEVRLTQSSGFVQALSADEGEHRIPATHVIAVSFPGGLPLVAGHDYRWQVELDGYRSADTGSTSSATTVAWNREALTCSRLPPRPPMLPGSSPAWTPGMSFSRSPP